MNTTSLPEGEALLIEGRYLSEAGKLKLVVVALETDRSETVIWSGEDRAEATALVSTIREKRPSIGFLDLSVGLIP